MEPANTLRRLLGLFSSAVRPDLAALQETFRNNYLSFRSLLTANNNALEMMADLEQALADGQPFGMAFVRGHSTALSVNVYKMIKSVETLSGGKYAALEEAFSRITAEIEEVLERQPEVPAGEYVIDLGSIGKEHADLVGDKMANLGEVGNRTGLDVPAGFVITAAATQRFLSASGLQDEINRLIQSLDINDLEKLYTVSAEIQKLITSAEVPAEIAARIESAYADLSGRTHTDVPVAMRSSAVGEDRRSVSFAGQYRTQLNVSSDLILHTYKEIVASKYRSQAIVYRHQRGFRHQDVTMSVGCLEMVDAKISGVMFSRSPRNPDSHWVEISAASGLGDQVVEGSADTDYYRVERHGSGSALLQATAGREPLLGPDRLHELAQLAVRLEDHFGVAQDIEWSIDRSGKIVILQSRPVAATPVVAEDEFLESEDDGGAESAWDDRFRRAAFDHWETPGEELCPGALLNGGVTASPGAAAGPVFVVRSNVDLLEFPEGAVLVVEDPLPDWASLMSKAVAVVSERGHVATHLAIVAREFGMPALFGVPQAMARMENGAMVTVDASARCVYEGRNEEALKRRAPKPNLMIDSPVYRILEEISQLCIPLNLTDPESPDFTPRNCRTLHDLTRFCHEKAVQEMFSFGEKTGFDKKAAKQLAGETPLKWWVIDLDDGFREDFDPASKFVFIQDIVSRPMIAIWEGMTSKPWSGPPPVSLKGFGSVLYRSTMNPSIDPAVRTSMGTKNYFLVSRNFCNLSMRLGYHFTLVEAYVGPHLTENYVSFQFRGGAASRERRFVRVHLLRDILELYGFRVEVLLDALTARIEKKEADYLLDRLRVLGYLLIHTRQIDMVMGEQVMVQHYRQMIQNDLAGIVAPKE